MNRINILYLTFTGLFSAFMLFSSIPDLMQQPEAITFITNLGYPKYFVPFIGIAKILGVIAILIPGFNRIKEWAYAGLAFDLIGATYSLVAFGGFSPGILFMMLPLTFLFSVVLFPSSENKYPCKRRLKPNKKWLKYSKQI